MSKLNIILKQARQNKNYSIVYVNSLCDNFKSPSTISNIENGYNLPSKKTLQDLCKIYQLDFTELHQLLKAERLIKSNNKDQVIRQYQTKCDLLHASLKKQDELITKLELDYIELQDSKELTNLLFGGGFALSSIMLIIISLLG